MFTLARPSLAVGCLTVLTLINYQGSLMVTISFIIEQLSYLSVPELIGGGIIVTFYLLSSIHIKDY